MKKIEEIYIGFPDSVKNVFSEKQILNYILTGKPLIGEIQAIDPDVDLTELKQARRLAAKNELTNKEAFNSLIVDLVSGETNLS